MLYKCNNIMKKVIIGVSDGHLYSMRCNIQSITSAACIRTGDDSDSSTRLDIHVICLMQIWNHQQADTILYIYI